MLIPLKVIHILSACFVVGVTFTYPLWVKFARDNDDVSVLNQLMHLERKWIGAFGIVSVVTGVGMMHMMKLSVLGTLWSMLALANFALLMGVSHGFFLRRVKEIVYTHKEGTPVETQPLHFPLALLMSLLFLMLMLMITRPV